MTIRLLQGDCRTILPTLAEGSVQSVVTSPPYYGLRDYGVAGQMGSEPSPDAYIAAMVAVFREVWRVLRHDGTLWLNIGDSYATGTSAPRKATTIQGPAVPASWAGRSQAERVGTPIGYKTKDLLMIPARVAIALQADGWYLRSDIIWHKPNPMPESANDRPTGAHEHVFMLTKAPHYFYDAEAIKEVGTIPAGTRAAKGSNARSELKDVNGRPPEYWEYDGFRNARNVWTIATKPFAGSHFATMPPDLAERCIKAGTSERGACGTCGAAFVRILEKRLVRTAADLTLGWKPACACPPAAPVPCVVLDPFGGAGTTGLVADRLQRDAVLIELSPTYGTMAGGRMSKDAPLFAAISHE
jgi:DNA modification methylase